jgi:hypothetical protein
MSNHGWAAAIANKTRVGGGGRGVREREGGERERGGREREGGKRGRGGERERAQLVI